MLLLDSASFHYAGKAQGIGFTATTTGNLAGFAVSCPPAHFRELHRQAILVGQTGHRPYHSREPNR